MTLSLFKHPGIRNFLLCVLSAVLLVFSFPKVDCGVLIWISLVPLLFVLDGRTKLKAFAYSSFVGLLFFFGSLYWLMYVTAPGAVILFFYFALYFAFFGFLYSYFSRQSFLTRTFVVPSSWVVLEFLRGHLLSGFGWASLAHSQYQNWMFIQIADITGIYGVSFLIVLVNVLVKENLTFAFGRCEVSQKELVRFNVVVLVILLGVFSYGFWRITHVAKADLINVGIIQGNTPQDEKWLFSERGVIIDKYLDLSRRSLDRHPDILIWPETAFPGMAAESPELMERIRDFARINEVPILLGIVTEEDLEYFNSAILVSAEGDVVGQYDKLHLVPFGEYLPLRKQFPFLTDLVPIDDFTAGKKETVFQLPVKNQGKLTDVRFSAAICFEDTLPHITRRFVRKGAQLLVNLTNDAWFRDSKAPFMHLQAALFRCVEAKRSLVRAANTGVSCGIDPYGRILKYVHNEQDKKTYVDGESVFFVPLSNEMTIYTKIGDVFTYFCFVCILWASFRMRRPIPSK